MFLCSHQSNEPVVIIFIIFTSWLPVLVGAHSTIINFPWLFLNFVLFSKFSWNIFFSSFLSLVLTDKLSFNLQEGSLEHNNLFSSVYFLYLNNNDNGAIYKCLRIHGFSILRFLHFTLWMFLLFSRVRNIRLRAGLVRHSCWSHLLFWQLQVSQRQFIKMHQLLLQNLES